MPLSPGEQILFTRQRHEALKMGLHWDYRLVAGDKAYSWATKKEMPEPGKAIVLFEQPVHDAAYALSQRVVIPKGEYGAGVTTLDYARKAKIGEHSTPEQLTIHANGEKYLLKKLPRNNTWGEKAWLFKNLGEYQEKKASVTSAMTLLEKIAAKVVESLQPHQESGLKKLDDSGGVLLHHGVGTGKTKSFLTAVSREQAKDKDARALIVAPASLVTNIDKEIAKHKLKIDPKRLDVFSYEKAVRDVDQIKKNKYAIAVADEAHKLRNADTKRSKELGEVISSAKKRVLATATGNYNHLADIAPLLNIVSGSQALPTDRKEVEKRLITKKVERPGILGRILGVPDKETEVLRNDKALKKLMEKHVSYYDSRENPKAADKFPTRTEEVVEVPMSEDQLSYYKYVEGNIPFMLRMKIRHNMPLDKKEKASLNSFSTGVRQVSNSYRHLRKDGNAGFTPKMEEASKRLLKRMKEDKNFKALVYSNFLDGGLEEYSKKLHAAGVNHALYTGKLSKSEKDALVKDYNSDKMKVLLISSSGSEGLDTKGTKLVQVLEPHFNKAKIDQVMGRADRYESHAHLPKEERKVHVEHYLSVHPEPMWGKTPYSIDKYLHENSQEKNELFEQVKKMMKESDK